MEILGIEQGRKWNVGSLNEFRKFFDLKPYETFEEINSDPDVADSLRHLYEHPDYVELYPGIVAEEAKEPMIPGVGIAPTYTISRAVLSDAVALVRGDRYYTVSLDPSMPARIAINYMSRSTTTHATLRTGDTMRSATISTSTRDVCFTSSPCGPSPTTSSLTPSTHTTQ